MSGNASNGAIRIGGYRPGALGSVTALHGSYYHRHWGFGVNFEAEVATELAEFLGRFDPAQDGFWIAEQGEHVVGSIAIDGVDANGEGARLRWFILDEVAHGQGVGARLLQTALEFCRAAGHDQVHLWTFAGLEAAAHLYRKAGFTLAQGLPSADWGAPVHTQQYRLNLRAAPTTGAAPTHSQSDDAR